MANFAVLDTETNWHNEVMSIGVMLADADTFQPLSSKYYILTPEYKIGGMFSQALFFRNEKRNLECSREMALGDLKRWFAGNGVKDIFAYNAAFDYGHLPELSAYTWYDIMKLAAYKQFNHKIKESCDCYRTGRLKRSYGVEAILRLLSDDQSYREQHNALTDAFDELKIMKLLQHSLDKYERLFG